MDTTFSKFNLQVHKTCQSNQETIKLITREHLSSYKQEFSYNN